MRAGVDWSAVAARECFDGACGEDLPGPFAELGRRARGEVRYPERDLWASVREDAAWPGASAKGACGGSCGCAGCGDGAAEVDDFWAPVTRGPGSEPRGLLAQRAPVPSRAGRRARRAARGPVPPPGPGDWPGSTAFMGDLDAVVSVDELAARASVEIRDGGRVSGAGLSYVWLVVGEPDAFRIYVVSMAEGRGAASFGGKKVVTRLDVVRTITWSDSSRCSLNVLWEVDCYRRRALVVDGEREVRLPGGGTLEAPFIRPERLVKVGQALISLTADILSKDGAPFEVKVEGEVYVLDSDGSPLYGDSFWNRYGLGVVEGDACIGIVNSCLSGLSYGMTRDGLLVSIWAQLVAEGTLRDDAEDPFMGPEAVSVESVLWLLGERTEPDRSSGLAFTVTDWAEDLCEECIEEVGAIPDDEPGGDDVGSQAPL